MADPKWDVYVLDGDRARVGLIDGYTAAEIVRRFNSVGAWRLEVPDAAAATSTTVNDYALLESGDFLLLESGDHLLLESDTTVAGATGASRLAVGGGVEFVRDGTTVLSGPVKRVEERLRDGRVTRTWSGVDWLTLLAERIIHPSASPFTADDYDDQTDATETLIHHYVKAQLGSTAAASRRVAGLTFATDAGLGDTLTTAGRFQTLLTEMAKIARVGGDLGFKLVKDGTDIEFSVYQPTDRSSSVVFSRELGNLTGYTRTVEAPRATHVVVGGSGTGTGRTFVEGGSADQQTWGRIERFVDDRATSDTTILGQTRDDALEADGEATSLAIDVSDTGPALFGVDYDLGDRVTVVAGGTTFADIVREVTIRLDRTGEDVTPGVRTPGSRDPSDPAIFGRLTDVERRLLDLERI